MYLYFLRHASAEEYSPKSDYERKLTNEGIKESKKIGKFCQQNRILPNKILTSPLIRAVETSINFRKELDPQPPIEKVEWLKSNMNINSLYSNTINLLEEKIKTNSNKYKIVLVSHEPNISLLITKLLSGRNYPLIKIKKASLTGLKFESNNPIDCQLLFSIPVNLT